MKHTTYIKEPHQTKMQEAIKLDKENKDISMSAFDKAVDEYLEDSIWADTGEPIVLS